MEFADLKPASGFVVDSSILVMAERGNLTTPEVIRNLREVAGDIPIVISALTVAELGHGINTQSRSRRHNSAENFSTN